MAHYFVIDDSFPVRVDDIRTAYRLSHNGLEEPYDAVKAMRDGREISKAEALRWWSGRPT